MDNIGACGDNCSVCPRYSATISNNEYELNKVKELWVLLDWRKHGINANDLKCTGCNKDNNCAYPELQECVFSKNIENCGLCSNYPCDLINAAFDKTDKLFGLFKDRVNKIEINSLFLAFNNKKFNLDKIHDSYKNKSIE